MKQSCIIILFRKEYEIASKHEGFVSCYEYGRLKFWDREFNSLDFEWPELSRFALQCLWHLHLDILRNEIVCIKYKQRTSEQRKINPI